MSDTVKVVIEIPEEKYAEIKRGINHFSLMAYAIRKGTPLPKGHGRLGDLDALEKLCTEHNIANSAYDNSPIIEQGHCSDGDCIWKPLFNFAPTIIAADKEE